jgi:CBS domain-containing membrane protein
MRRKWSRIEEISSWLKTFLPASVNIGRTERLRAGTGMLVGLLLTGLATRLMLGAEANIPLLVAPMGASAVLLFAIPSSPLAQPWSIMGGNIISALIGVTCARHFTDPILAASLAAALAVGAMFALRCLHPPGGAVALTTVLGGPWVLKQGYDFVLFPIALNSALMMLTAVAYNNLTGHRYPHASQPDHSGTHGTTDARSIDRLGYKPEDLDAVLKKYDEVLDVSRGDLESIFFKQKCRLIAGVSARLPALTSCHVMSA